MERLSKVHPELRRRAIIIAERLKAQGVTVEVVQGFRTAVQQEALYAQGRTKPGKRVTNARAWQSNHSYGLAVDFCIFEKGKPNWNAPQPKWKQIGVAAESVGLEWGGRWKFVDMPHVQLSGLSVAQCYALYRKGGLPLVWERATAALKAVDLPVEVLPAPKPAPAPASIPTSWPLTVPELKHVEPPKTAASTTTAIAKYAAPAAAVGVAAAWGEWLVLHWWGVSMTVLLCVGVVCLVGLWWERRRQSRVISGDVQ